MIEDVNFFIMVKLKLCFNRLQSAILNYINRFLKMCFLNTHVKDWFSSKPHFPAHSKLSRHGTRARKRFFLNVLLIWSCTGDFL